MEPWRQRQPGPIGQHAVALAVLIHDRQALDPAVARPGPGDVGDPCIEIALLAQQALVDHVADDMGDPAPVGGGGGVGGALDLLARQHVP